MLKNLLRKELRLALHPTTPIFLLLSSMLLIPNYPYYVIFFYTCLGTFFLCLNGRENRDIYYTLLLPVRKRQLVLARMLVVVLTQLAQVLFAIPFAFLRGALIAQPNEAGMEANTALFGVALLLLGIFNLVFFTRYYRDTDKVGSAFLWGLAAFLIIMMAAETVTFAVPFVRDNLDTADPAALPVKLIILIAGIAAYIALTLLAYRRAASTFDALDF